MKKAISVAFMSLFMAFTSFSAFAAEPPKDDSVIDTAKQKGGTAWEKTKDVAGEGVEDTKKVSKKAYRKIKDKTCEMVNGKLECLGDRAKHSIQNTGDEAKDKLNDLKK